MAEQAKGIVPRVPKKTGYFQEQVEKIKINLIIENK